MTTNGPVTVEGVRGWPLPDAGWDPCGADADLYGWLPWAVIHAGPDWYVGLYSCDRGHRWTCGYGMVAARDDPGLRVLKVSPYRIVPSAPYLHEHGIPRPVQLEIVDWSWLLRRRHAGPSAP